MIEQPPTGTLEAGSLASSTTFAFGWVVFPVASLRARVFPRSVAILLIAGGVVGFGFLIFPGAVILLAVAVGWRGFSLR
ncbi:MAG: hypothetical protein M3259_10640 [Actinomycetota bacterium]|nr:hypothetical protein [Actinomycetota bacterium]